MPRTHCARSLSGEQITTRSTHRCPRETRRGRRERVVTFELDHGPNHEAECAARVFGQAELREQYGVETVAGLVTRI